MRLRAMGYAGPVVAVTGGSEGDTAAELLDRGFADVVHKPAPVSRLLDIVAQHVAAGRTQRATASGTTAPAD